MYSWLLKTSITKPAHIPQVWQMLAFMAYAWDTAATSETGSREESRLPPTVAVTVPDSYGYQSFFKGKSHYRSELSIQWDDVGLAFFL